MAARAIWKGTIRFGDVAVPVKLYSAVEERGVHLRLLHAKDGTPVKQVMVHPGTGEPVPHDQVRKGYDTGEGSIVILSDEELESLEPEASRDVEVTEFVEPRLIGYPWYDRPYYLGPDGNEAAYSALARALEAEGKEGVVRWTMRKKEYVGALRAEGGHLELITLHHASEIVDASTLPRPKGRAPEKQELQMAEQLVKALAGEFDVGAYRDEYREKVLELVEKKARGEALKLGPPKRRKAEAASLTDVLRASLERVKEERQVA
ncbi:MAG: Ku protein [Deltaproteobacteria bacterium]|nr:Ku protein [Deltaproteobacteria bacterium]